MLYCKYLVRRSISVLSGRFKNKTATWARPISYPGETNPLNLTCVPVDSFGHSPDTDSPREHTIERVKCVARGAVQGPRGGAEAPPHCRRSEAAAGGERWLKEGSGGVVRASHRRPGITGGEGPKSREPHFSSAFWVGLRMPRTPDVSVFPELTRFCQSTASVGPVFMWALSMNVLGLGLEIHFASGPPDPPPPLPAIMASLPWGVPEGGRERSWPCFGQTERCTFEGQKEGRKEGRSPFPA